MKKIECTLPFALLEFMDAQIEAGMYATRDEVISDAMRKLLFDHIDLMSSMEDVLDEADPALLELFAMEEEAQKSGKPTLASRKKKAN